MFEPLEVSPIPYQAADPEIRANGSSLYLPSPVTRTALLLRYAGGGVRMFRSNDLDISNRFNVLITQLAEARDAYVRGVTEERGRIARDLHDDVSARLLTSLHRTTTDAIHQDVRSAMADIRTIVTGLSGQPQSLHALLANLRHETQARLEAASIELFWPLTLAGEQNNDLDYASYRQLLSIVRECVSNVIRHSAASQAQVLIDVQAGYLTVEIKDDGCGIECGRANGNGLDNAERRALAVGGEFSIASSAAGTTARLNLPITA